VRHRQTKGAATDMFDLQPPRHISTLRNLVLAARSGEGPRIGRTRRRCESPMSKSDVPSRAKLVGSGTAGRPIAVAGKKSGMAAPLPVLQPGGVYANAKEQVASLQSAIYPREIGAISAADRSDARRGCHQRPATTSPPVLNCCRPVRTSPRTSRYWKSPSTSSSTVASPTAPICKLPISVRPRAAAGAAVLARITSISSILRRRNFDIVTS